MIWPAEGWDAAGLDPQAVMRATTHISRLNWLNDLNRELGQSITKASELKCNAPCLGMGPDLVDRQYKLKRFAHTSPDSTRSIASPALSPRSGCVEHLTWPTRSNSDRLSCTISQAYREQPD